MPYTHVDFSDAVEVISAAGLPPLLSLTPLAGGWANSNYLLGLGDESFVVLKVWNERTPEQVSHLIEQTDWLVEHGVPTPASITFSDNSRMMVKDRLAWTLLPFVRGEWLTSDVESLRELGRVQARLHSVPITDAFPTSFSMGFEQWQKLFDIAGQQDSWSSFLSLLRDEEELLRQSIPDSLPAGIIHGDLFPDNVLGSRGEVAAILDFEEVHIGAKAFDLVMTFVGFGWHEGEPILERWEALRAGYEEIRPLQDDEIAALPALHRYATLSIAAWRYWQFVMNIPGTEHEGRYLEMVERLDKQFSF